MKDVFTYAKRLVASKYLSVFLRYFIGFIFIYASMTKITYPAEFAKNVEAYRLIPYWAINAVAIFLPWLEMICGLFLVIGLLTRASAAVLTVLLAAFTIALAINVIRGAPISCGCWSSVDAQIGWYDVIRDIVLLLFTAQIFFFDRILIFRRVGFLTHATTGSKLRS